MSTPFKTNLVQRPDAWRISNPSATIFASPEMITIDNTIGESAACTLHAFEFKPGKQYVCECEIAVQAEARLKGEMDEVFAGILLFAEDAGSGYGWLVNKGHEIMLGSMDDGEMLDLWFGRYPSNSSGVVKLRFEADEVLWKCFVQDDLSYVTNARFRTGSLAGVYVGSGLKMDVTAFTIAEQDYIPRCTLPFSESEFHHALRRVMDAAPEDFVAIEGTFSHESGDCRYWNVKDIALPGAQDLFLQRGGITQPHRLGRNFMISFGCAPYTDRTDGLELFTRIVNAIDAFRPTNGMLHYLGTREDLSPTFLKSTAYEYETTHPLHGDVCVILQCDFSLLNREYYTFIQVNVRI